MENTVQSMPENKNEENLASKKWKLSLWMNRWLISVCLCGPHIFFERKHICMQAPAQVRTHICVNAHTRARHSWVLKSAIRLLPINITVLLSLVCVHVCSSLRWKDCEKRQMSERQKERLTSARKLQKDRKQKPWVAAVSGAMWERIFSS